MRVATFNVQNLRRREDAGGVHFDGARDNIRPLSKLSAEERAADLQDRALTAELIAEADADVLSLQEVFDQRTLDEFHDAYLAPRGAHYPHRVCMPGNDGRRHVALMSRLPLEDVKSHATLSYDDLDLAPPPGLSGAERIFKRDCLTATCNGLLLLVVHFKAPADAASLAVVQLEALTVRLLIERRFADPAAACWLVAGDVNVNDAPRGDAIQPLTENFAMDLAASLPSAERWTYFYAEGGNYARPDRILASPAAARLCRAFEVRREGMSRAATAYAGPRLEGVGDVRPRASDHAMLIADIAI